MNISNGVFAESAIELRLPSFSRVPGALTLWAILGALALPNIAAAQFVFTADDTRDLSDINVGDSQCATAEGTCTLRAAIEEISAFSCNWPYDRIILQPGTYLLTQQSALRIGFSSWVSCIVIEGTGNAAATVIDGNAPTGEVTDIRALPVFQVGSQGIFQPTGITITKGHDHTAGGGGIQNEGAVTMRNSILTRNSTHGRGGALLNKNGYIWIIASTFSDNWARPNFAYDWNGDGTKDEVAGGAIANIGGQTEAYLENVTVTGNRGGLDAKGGKGYNGDGGGGILNVGGGLLDILNSTIAYNQTKSQNGSGIYSDTLANVNNSVIAQNYYTSSAIKYGDDCKGTFNGWGSSLVGVADKYTCTLTNNYPPYGGVHQVGTYYNPIDPLLGPLANNGGPTPTHKLLPGSPAIDAAIEPWVGEGGLCTFDQRGLPRPKDGPSFGYYDGVAVCDIGAYEYAAPELSVGDKAVTEGNSGTKNMSFQVSLSYPSVEPISVSYFTTAGSAKAGSDYQTASGSVLFNPGEASKSIVVKIVGDKTKEPNETLYLNVSVGSGLARIKDGQAVAKIVNDD